MSALPPKADIARQRLDVRFVPKADKVHRSKMGLFDYLVSNAEQSRREAERASVDTYGYIYEVRRGIGLSRMIDAVVVQVTRSHGHRPAFLRNIYVPVSLKEQTAASGWRFEPHKAPANGDRYERRTRGN
jgi:hypothetical protein